MSRLGNLIRKAYASTSNYTVSLARRFYKMSPFGKSIVILIILVNALLASIIISLGPEGLFQFMFDTSQKLASNPYGWLILVALMIVTCFPPLFGYTTLVTICGFAYGLKGIFIAAPSALFGSALTFVVLRSAFKTRLGAMRESNESWVAMEAVIRAQGLPLIALIRFCPFPPWVYANAMFASIESVSLIQFMLATLVVFPKLMLSVFIGSQVAMLADGDKRGQMDTKTKVINVVSIVLGATAGLVAGWIVYRLTQKRIREYDGLPRTVDDLAAEALDVEEGFLNRSEGAPLLRGNSWEGSRDELDER